MKTKWFTVASTLLLSLVYFDVSGQLQEIGLTQNPALIKSNRHKRSEETKPLKIFVPIGGSTTFCPDEDMLRGTFASLTYQACDGDLQGSFEAGDTCLTYQHSGGRSMDIICLEVCDSNGVCNEFRIAFISGPTIDLPFFDDFSSNQPYPDTSLWLDRDVFINTTLAERPLTVGIATFDGLNEFGTPYEARDGFSDDLTSAFIDLSDQSEIYFSFFAQPKGVGIKPRIKDSLVVDFRDERGNWVRAWQMKGLPDSYPNINPAPDFEFIRVAIPDSLLHANFQFRFRNKSKNEGLQELWHIDYVRLGSDELTQDQFRDIAFRFLPTSILDPYSSMPANQFQIGEVRRNIVSHLNNLDQVDLTMNDPTIKITSEGQTLLRRTFIEPVELWLLPPGATSFDFDMNDQGSKNYEDLQTALFGLLQPGQEYSILNTLQFTRIDEIIGATSNNQVQRYTHFSNYYSYDDGTAETAIIDDGAQGVQTTTLAVEYHNNAPDNLQGIQMHIPHIEGNSGNQFFNLYVWIDSLDEEPEYTQLGVRVYYADSYYDTLQGFTTYALLDSNEEKISLPLPEGKFYIGWEQPDITGNKIPIGYDVNSPIGIDFLYYSVGQGWQSARKSGLRAGSLMMRPVLGSEAVIPTAVKYKQWDELKIYPNPSSEWIYIEGNWEDANGTIELFDMSGARILAKPLQSSIDVHNFAAGIYLIKVTNLKAQKITSRLIEILH